MTPLDAYALADACERAGGADGWIYVPGVGYLSARRLPAILDAARGRRGRHPRPEATWTLDASHAPWRDVYPRTPAACPSIVVTWPPHGVSRGATVRLALRADPVVDLTTRDHPLIAPTVAGLRERDPARGVVVRGWRDRHGRETRFRASSVGAIAPLVVASDDASEVPRAA